MVDEAIKKAIEIVGSQKKLALKVGVSQPNVWSWLHKKKKVSPERVPRLVNATNGQVKAYQFRPDLPDLFPTPNTDKGNCDNSLAYSSLFQTSQFPFIFHMEQNEPDQVHNIKGVH